MQVLGRSEIVKKNFEDWITDLVADVPVVSAATSFASKAWPIPSAVTPHLRFHPLVVPRRAACREACRWVFAVLLRCRFGHVWFHPVRLIEQAWKNASHASAMFILVG